MHYTETRKHRITELVFQKRLLSFCDSVLLCDEWSRETNCHRTFSTGESVTIGEQPRAGAMRRPCRDRRGPIEHDAHAGKLHAERFLFERVEHEPHRPIRRPKRQQRARQIFRLMPPPIER